MIAAVQHLPPVAEPLYRAATAPGGDPTACLVLADLYEEAGDDVGAAAWRWLGRNAYAIAEDDPDALEPDAFDLSVLVRADLLPDTVLYQLPAPHINDTGGPEDKDSSRILNSLWINRQAFVEDFLTAWRAAYEEPTEEFQLTSD